MLIDETIADDGSFRRTHLDATDDGVVLREDEDEDEGLGTSVDLPAEVVIKVMQRYGKPLDESVIPRGEKLDLGAGITLQVLSFQAQVDVLPSQYLVLHTPGQDPLAASSKPVASALRYLAQQIMSHS